MNYSVSAQKKRPNKWRKALFTLLTVVLLGGAGFLLYSNFFAAETVEKAIEVRLEFDDSITSTEQELVKSAISNQAIILESSVTVSASTATSLNSANNLLDVYVPVTELYSVRQNITSEELKTTPVTFSESIDPIIKQAIIGAFSLPEENTRTYTSLEEIDADEIAFINEKDITYTVKLLSLDNEYFLDSLNSGGMFREAVYSGDGATQLASLNLGIAFSESDVLKINMTGVTALTREMQKKLAVVKDPLYFSANIGKFLADADITHVSNEVSFSENCQYSYSLFCSPPEFIETLKASGVDLVELTGNHNNDLGSENNLETIQLYQQLGWGTVGGGINDEEARKPYIVNQDGSTVAVLAYNYPDSPNGGAIAGPNRAGANVFDFSFASIEEDIIAAKEASDFVIVSVQYWECYAYPDGYVEYPICDKPIGEQEATFKKLVDLGADMVVGSSAHQPQTYELYNGKPIYYGLGNLYFEQTQWPGTERSIVLSHYYKDGALLQTKLTPTVYDDALQTRVATDEEANYLLTRLNEARE